MSSSPPPLPSNPNDNAASRILGATLTCTALALVTVITRIYVRTRMTKAWGWDDYFILLAMALSLAAETLIVASVHYGAGKHIGDVPQDAYVIGMKFNFFSQSPLIWGVCVVKISVGLALLRIATGRFWRWLIQGIMVFMVIYTFGCFMTFWVQCKQVAMMWNPAIPRRCWTAETLQGLAFTHAALNIVTDFIFAVMIPIPMLWKLRMNRRTKGAVMAVLSLGVFVCLAGLLRLPTIVNYGKAGDFLWDSTYLSIWFVAEFNTGIIAASAPALKPLFSRVLDSTYKGGLSRRSGYAQTNDKNSQNHTSSYSVKAYGGVTRLDDPYGDFESGSRVSQQDLVDRKDIQLGAIEKTVTSSVTVTGMPNFSKPARDVWDK